jgi:cyclin-dependent kinase regulatory subunit CKS1
MGYYDENWVFIYMRLYTRNRHVVLPKQIIKWIPHSGLLSEEQWRKLGIKQSKGWAHYMVYGKYKYK